MKKLLYLAAVMVTAMLGFVACDKNDKGTDGDEPLPNMENVKAVYSAEGNSIVISLGDYMKTNVTPVFQDGVCVSYIVSQVWAKESWARQIMEKVPEEYIGATRKGNTITASYTKDVLDLGIIGISQSKYKDYVDQLIKYGNSDDNGGDNGGDNGDDDNDKVSYAAPATMYFNSRLLNSVQGMKNEFGRPQDNYNLAFAASFTAYKGKTTLDYITMNYGYYYTVRSLSPLVFCCDNTTYPYPSFVDQHNLTLNENGYVTTYSNNDGEIRGKFSYSDFGLIESATWEYFREESLDDTEASETINASYSFNNDGETLYGISGTYSKTEVYDDIEYNNSYTIDMNFEYSASAPARNTSGQIIPFIAKVIGGYVSSYDAINYETGKFALLGYFGKGSSLLPNRITIIQEYPADPSGMYEPEIDETVLEFEYTFNDDGTLNTVTTYEVNECDGEDDEKEVISAYEYSYYDDEE